MAKYAEVMSLQQWLGEEEWRAALPHSRDDHALIWITRGQGRAVIDGVLRGLTVHTALAIPAGTMLHLDLSPQTFGTVCVVPKRSLALMPDQTTILRVRDAHAQTELSQLLDTMQREQQSDRPFMDEAMNAHAAMLTVWLRRAIIDQRDDQIEYSAAQRLAMAYTALIERDFTSGKPMSDYAAALGVTPTHLTRACRTSAGMTASELLTGRTVFAMRDLLETTDHPANRIAAMLGFKSAAYFSRFVLQHTGQTPTNLRKAALATEPAQ
ncbi:MAG: helix-turn-helix transcriptional regulator [Pseudomonadota bacterium]